MSSYYDPENPPPPPAESASLKQIVVMLAFGTMGSLFVINAIRSQPGNSLGVGAALILCALVFFAGLISKLRWVELFASGFLLLGAGVLVAITINTREVLWAVGAVFFALCVVVIQLKHKFVDQSASTSSSDEPRNPYS